MRSRLPVGRSGRVVLDTNVLVAAGFNTRSHAARIVEAVRTHRLKMAWSVGTKRESEHVIRRIPPLHWRDFEELFDEASRVCDAIDVSSYAYILDPADRVFAALAHATGASLITGDDHLLAHRSRADVPVLTTHEFVRFAWGDDSDTQARESRQTTKDPQRIDEEAA